MLKRKNENMNIFYMKNKITIVNNSIVFLLFIAARRSVEVHLIQSSFFFFFMFHHVLRMEITLT